MIEQIKEQAVLLQNRLWDIARDCYGLDRTPETVERIRATFTAQMNEKCHEAGLPHLEKAIGGVYEPVEGGLAIAFMCTALINKETDSGEALAMLTVASEALGTIKIVSMLRVIGKAGPIDLEKLGEVGDSLTCPL